MAKEVMPKRAAKLEDPKRVAEELRAFQRDLRRRSDCSAAVKLRDRSGGLPLSTAQLGPGLGGLGGVVPTRQSVGTLYLLNEDGRRAVDENLR